MSQSNDVQPEWQPPAGLRDPLVRRYLFTRDDAKGRATWSRTSRGRIDGVREQAVAWRLADYGNKDGHNCHPGMARLAADTCSSEKTVRRAMAWLTENGWCTVTHRGRRKLGEADVYALSIPAPVAVDVGMWTEGNGVQWMERPADEPKRPELRQDTPRFPAVKGDPYTDVLEVTPGLLEDTGGLLPVNVDLPPGPTHPVLSTPLRDSITASRTRARRDEKTAFDPDAVDYDEKLIDYINDRLGGTMHSMTEQLVLSMIANGANWKMIVHTAVARDHLFAS